MRTALAALLSLLPATALAQTGVESAGAALAEASGNAATSASMSTASTTSSSPTSTWITVGPRGAGPCRLTPAFTSTGGTVGGPNAWAS